MKGFCAGRLTLLKTLKKILCIKNLTNVFSFISTNLKFIWSLLFLNQYHIQGIKLHNERKKFKTRKVRVQELHIKYPQKMSANESCENFSTNRVDFFGVQKWHASTRSVCVFCNQP